MGAYEEHIEAVQRMQEYIEHNLLKQFCATVC